MKSLSRFDLVEKKWEKVFEHIVMFNDENDVPIGRYRHECVTYMDRWIFMIAGGTSREVFSSRRVFVFDTVLKNWIQVFEKYVSRLFDRLISGSDEQNSAG